MSPSRDGGLSIKQQQQVAGEHQRRLTAIAYLNKMSSPLRSPLRWPCRFGIGVSYIGSHHMQSIWHGGTILWQTGNPVIITAEIGNFCHQFSKLSTLGGSLYNRSVCEEDKFSTARLLQLEARSTGESKRCPFNFLFNGPAVSLPPFHLIRRALLNKRWILLVS